MVINQTLMRTNVNVCMWCIHLLIKVKLQSIWQLRPSNCIFQRIFKNKPKDGYMNRSSWNHYYSLFFLCLLHPPFNSPSSHMIPAVTDFSPDSTWLLILHNFVSPTFYFSVLNSILLFPFFPSSLILIPFLR